LGWEKTTGKMQNLTIIEGERLIGPSLSDRLFSPSRKMQRFFVIVAAKKRGNLQKLRELGKSAGTCKKCSFSITVPPCNYVTS
jgi:hypothetical protein